MCTSMMETGGGPSVSASSAYRRPSRLCGATRVRRGSDIAEWYAAQREGSVDGEGAQPGGGVDRQGGIAAAGREHLADVHAMGGVGGQMAHQFTVKPELTAAKDRAPGRSRHDAHADEGVLMARRRWIESAWDQSIVGVERGQREGGSCTAKDAQDMGYVRQKILLKPQLRKTKRSDLEMQRLQQQPD